MRKYDDVIAVVVAAIMGVAFIAAMYFVITSENERKRLYRIALNKCYSQGMILAKSDIGNVCIDPKLAARP